MSAAIGSSPNDPFTARAKTATRPVRERLGDARDGRGRRCAVPLLGVGIAVLLSYAIGRAADSALPPSPGGRAFLAALAAAFGCYALASWLLERTPARLSLVLAIGVVVQLTPLAGPLLLSADAHSYAAYGRIDAALGGNPYTDPPAAFPSDPVAKSVAGGWRDTPSVYGPLFAGLSIGVARAAGNNPSTASRVFRAIAAVSMLTLMGLAALISRRPDRAAAFVAWNPLLAVHFAGGGHNDATMMVSSCWAHSLWCSGATVEQARPSGQLRQPSSGSPPRSTLSGCLRRTAVASGRVSPRSSAPWLRSRLSPRGATASSGCE